jgi:hypothetical protein
VNFLTPGEVRTGIPANLKFFVNILPQRSPVLNLDIEHEKYMHVIGVRDDLTNFFHIHPDNAGGGIWNVWHSFNEPGKYKLWSDVTYQGETHSYGHNTFQVTGSTTAQSSSRYIEFINHIVVDKYQVHADYPTPIVMGRETDIHFTIEDYTGNGIELEPYLGADMHLAVIRDDLSSYIHTHPEGHSEMDDHHSYKFINTALAHGPEGDPIPDKEVHFTVNFPEAGVYKMFAQFRPKGIDLPADQSLVAEFFVRVAESGPAYAASAPDHHADEAGGSAPNKGVMVVISLVLIAVLGWASYRFINVKL